MLFVVKTFLIKIIFFLSNVICYFYPFFWVCFFLPYSPSSFGLALLIAHFTPYISFHLIEIHRKVPE
jgi:hypothetical protein